MADIVRNLLPGQYQIGDIVFGRGTTVRVETFDIKPYDINAQDYQVSRVDEIRFGFDQFKPTTLEITFHVLHNRLFPQYAASNPNFWRDMPDVADFQREWRADDIRNMSGAMKAIYVCDRDGITKAVYGRPGQFTYAQDTRYTESVQCLGEFRRADTLAYGVIENAINISPGAIPQTITRTNGDCDTWLQVFLEGPMTHPVITIGSEQIELDTELLDGDVVEISSYPWQRRVVNNNRVNLSANLVGKTQYLDRLKIPANQPIPVRWTSEEYGTFVPDLNNASWMLDINRLNTYTLPNTFTTIMGRAITGFSIFGLYIAAGLLQNTTAIVYTDQHFKTNDQYSEAYLSVNLTGKSAIVIMSDDNMTNFAALSVEVGVLGISNFLRIYSGTSPTNVTQRASYTNTALFGWSPIDKIGFGYNPSTKTYTGYLNGTAVVNWPDPTSIVTTGPTKRSQGYIFDMNGNLLTEGAGFRRLLSYDRVLAPAELGSVVLVWRDAYSVVV